MDLFEPWRREVAQGVKIRKKSWERLVQPGNKVVWDA